MVNNISIDGVDYSSSFIDWDIEKANNFFSGIFEAILFDEDNSIYSTIERYNQAVLFFNANKKFTGVITDIIPSSNNTGRLVIQGQDYWLFALKEPLIRTFTNQTSSQIIKSVVAVELAGLNLTVVGVVDTTNIISNDSTGTKMIYRGNEAISTVFQDLVLRENFVMSIDNDKDVIFRSNTAVDSGVALVYGTNIIKEDIVRLGGDIVNVVRVRGAPGQPPATPPVGAIVEDDALIAKYATSEFDGRLPIVTITRTELGTPEACQEAGLFEIRKRNQDPDRGTVLRELLFDVDVNELVTLTIPHKGITAQTFIVQNIHHSFSGNSTTLDVIYFTRQTADLVQIIMEQNRRTEIFLIDDDVIFDKFKKLNEEIMITATFDVESRTFSGAEYGEFNYGEKAYGEFSGSFSSDVSVRALTVTNQFIEDWLRIIGQLATVPTTIDASNSFIAIGSDATVVQVTDTTLASENFRKGMNPGYPNQVGDGELEWKATLNDIDAITAIIRNLALFNDSAVGSLLLGGTLASDLNKTADQEIDFTIKISISSSTGFLTTAGKNLLRNLLILADVNYLDNSNAAIEIITTPVARTAMDSGHPKFTNVSNNELIFQTTVDVVTQDGKTFSGVDLYNKTSGGTQVIDGALSITTTISQLQGLKIQVLMKLIR